MSDWRCDLCGSASHEPLSSWVVRCSNCGLTASYPLPSAKELQERYGGDYYAGWNGGGRRDVLWQRRMRIVQDFIVSGRILDIGCGSGEFLRVAAKAGFEPSGTEFSDAARSAIKDFNVYRYPTEAPGTFDAVTLWHVLEHTPSPHRALEEVRSKLSPRGWLFVAVPNLESRWFDCVYRIVKRKPPELYSPQSKEPHLFHFSRATLAKLLENCDFDIVRTAPDVPDADMRYRLADLPARFWFKISKTNWTLTLLMVARKRD